MAKPVEVLLFFCGMALLFENAESKMLDLTHVLNSRSQQYPIFREYNITMTNNSTLPDGMWVFANELHFAEHTGTHIDAPAHTWLGGIKLHEIPLENLIAPAVVIDVIEKVKSDQDYKLAIQDIIDHEAKHGQIPDKAMVFMNTDGDKTYWDREAYMGSNTTSDISTLHFPAFGGPAVTWLIENRNINGIGVDRVSLDAGQKGEGQAHKALLSSRWRTLIAGSNQNEEHKESVVTHCRPAVFHPFHWF